MGLSPLRSPTLTTTGVLVGRSTPKGVNINRYMVESGSCWVYPLYAKDQDLFKLQSEAQAAERRLWRLPENGRVPPWEWRRR